MIQIIEAKTRSQIREFVDFPNVFYKDVEQFVPGTFADDLDDWNPKKNPAFSFCEARAFLAVRDGKTVGRIGAIYNKRANEKWAANRMRFTCMDFIDDREVSGALLKTVEDWAVHKGCNEIHGPLGFTDMDREGLLVEGFDRNSLFFTYYNHPYYMEHLEEYGYEKDVDWIENRLVIPDNDETEERLKKLAELSMKKYNLHLANAKHQWNYWPLIPPFFRLVNICYADLYSTTELDSKQIKKYAAKFAPLINPKVSAFVMDENNEMVALGVGAPSIGKAIKKSNGRMLPFGWARMLYALFVKNDTIDLLLIGVHPDYQKRGVNAIVMSKLIEGCHQMGITHAETGPTLELNSKVLSQWRGMEKEQHKRRRCYKKQLSSN